MDPITTIRYRGPSLPGCAIKLTLNKHAPDDDYAIDDGIVVRTGGNSAGLCNWSTIAYLLPQALAVSPELRADIRKALDEAEAKAGGAA